MSEKYDGVVTNKLSQEFSRTESCILGAVSKVDEFLLTPQARAHSGPVPEISRNSNEENQETNGDRPQNDLHLEVGVSLSHSSQNFCPAKIFDRCFVGKNNFSYYRLLAVAV